MAWRVLGIVWPREEMEGEAGRIRVFWCWERPGQGDEGCGGVDQCVLMLGKTCVGVMEGWGRHRQG